MTSKVSELSKHKFTVINVQTGFVAICNCSKSIVRYLYVKNMDILVDSEHMVQKYDDLVIFSDWQNLSAISAKFIDK